MADIINENSILPVKYLSIYDKKATILNNYKILDNFMSVDFSDDDIEFSYYGFPDNHSDFYLGDIILLTNKYNILGVTIGDNLKKSVSKIEQYGFKVDSKRSNSFSVYLDYGKFEILLDGETEDYDESEDEVLVGYIHLRAVPTYIGNEVY